MERMYALGSMGVLPPELIHRICESLTLEDIAALQSTHPHLSNLITVVFFRQFKRLDVSWDESGAIFFLSRSLHPTSACSTYSISSLSPCWTSILRSCPHIRHLFITKTAAVKDYAILEHIQTADYKLTHVEILLREHHINISPSAEMRGYKKLIGFVSRHSATLSSLRLETSSNNSILLTTSNQETTLHYQHKADFRLHTQLVYPLFHAMMQNRAGSSSLRLRVDWEEQPELCLQSAFQTALPHSHRPHLRTLRLEFGEQVALLSAVEIQRIFAVYAPYLGTTRRLQHVVCDLSNSKLCPSELEKLYTCVSGELGSVHRISVLTSGHLSADSAPISPASPASRLMSCQ